MLLDKYGVTFNGKHTYRDLGLVLLTKTIGLPARTTQIVRPPYSNHPIDYSSLYGHTIYDDREFTCEFMVRDQANLSKEALANKFTAVITWLEELQGRTPLIDDVAPGYYYLAEPAKAPTWEELLSLGKLTIDWTCNPLRTCVKPEGNTRWNDLNVNYDVSQHTSYQINGATTIHLINKLPEPVQPTITVEGDLTLVVDDQEQHLTDGVYAPVQLAYPPILKKGATYLAVSGTGTITFTWQKEMV